VSATRQRAQPFGTHGRIAALRREIDIGIEMHAHNDLGLATATANTLAAMLAGATHASTTVNGLGERAGNAALEEVVMAARHLYAIDCGLDTTALPRISQLVAHASGRPVVQRDEYRADLYYRINVVSIFRPPLRERRADIPPLVAHFLDRYNKENRRELKVTPEAMKVLTSCYWPGNVRELENCIERTATMVQDDTIRDLAFPCKQNRCLTQTLHFLDKADAVAAVAGARPVPISVPVPVPRMPARVGDDLDDNGHDDDDVLRIGPTRQLPPPPGKADAGEPPPQGERERLIWAMEQCGWVQAKAARLLRITPRQLGYALQKNRIEVMKF